MWQLAVVSVARDVMNCFYVLGVPVMDNLYNQCINIHGRFSDASPTVDGSGKPPRQAEQAAGF